MSSNKRRIAVNGVDLMVTEYNEASTGDPVLFLHPGGMLASYVWNSVIPSFQKEYRVLTLDLRGHGESETPAAGYDMETLTSDIIGLLDALGIDRAHLVGSSLGGDIATHAAARHPERVLSLINVDSGIINYIGPNGENEESKEEILTARANRVIPEYDSREDFVQQVSEQWAPLNEMARQMIALCPLRTLPNGRVTFVQANEIGVQIMDTVCDMRFETCYPRIKCPVLFLPAEQEAKLDVKRALIESYRKHLSFSKTVVLPGTTHIPQFDHGEAVSQVIRDFLAEI